MAINNTLSALNSLSDKVPGLNQRALKQVQAARDITLQSQLGAAPAQAPVKATAGQLATQRAMQGGQDIIAQRQQAQQASQQIKQATLQQTQQHSQQALQEQKLAQEARLQQQQQQQLQQLRTEELQSRKQATDEELAATAQLLQLGVEQDNRLQIATLQQREDLSRIGLNLKEQLIDSRIQFGKDERGRKFLNERQLVDWAATNARGQQEFNAQMSELSRAAEWELLALKQINANLTETLKRGFMTEQDDLDFESKKELARLKSAMDDKIRRRQAAARNRQAIFTTAGTLIGAAFGPTGAVVGGATGAAIGGATA